MMLEIAMGTGFVALAVGFMAYVRLKELEARRQRAAHDQNVHELLEKIMARDYTEYSDAKNARIGAESVAEARREWVLGQRQPEPTGGGFVGEALKPRQEAEFVE
jgi:hypothetical protein